MTAKEKYFDEISDFCIEYGTPISSYNYPEHDDRYLKQCYYNLQEKLVWLLLATILGTPFAIILDIITLPIQIIYYVCLKIIRKIRRKVYE